MFSKSFFDDREDAGRQLVHELTSRQDLKLSEKPIVLGLPRGGVPVAAEVAQALNADLDVLVVRKLGVPFRPELAMGAVGEEGITVLNSRIIEHAEISETQQEEVIRQQRHEVAQRVLRFRPEGRKPLPLQGRTTIIVDDGVATGATAQVAGNIARARGADWVVLAIPVAPYTVFQHLVASDAFDVVVCLFSPTRFHSVGACYRDFAQVSDAEVRHILGA